MDGDARGDGDQQGRKDDEGFVPCSRREGTEFTRPVAEFGECVMYLPAASPWRNKFDVRWMDGVWLGSKKRVGRRS